MKKVITYGSFDLFHDGHYKLLERAKNLGDYLIVGITTENFDEKRGKLNIVNTLIERIDNVRKTNLADEIIIEDHEGQKLEDIQKYEIDIFAIGSDWKNAFEYIRPYCEVVYLERTRGISSTSIRNQNFKMLHFGIIGSGRIASRFVPEAKSVSGANINGVYNPNRDSAKKFAHLNELNFYSNSLDDFFNKIDVVYIASPHHTHFDYAKKSLHACKHVLCEKPLTLNKLEAEELYSIAKEKGLILFEAIKTAYCPGFTKMVSMLKSKSIGEIKDVEACFTKLAKGNLRELDPKMNGGSFAELASYPLLAIFKILGTNYKSVRFESFVNEQGIDLYTKAYLTFEDSIATAKVGLGVKSEGQLIASGTQGFLIANSPWWKTESFEIKHEDSSQNEKFFYKYYGDGLRYEVNDFVSMINGNSKKGFKLTAQESISIAKVVEQFLASENRINLKI